jgi:hypothetical protein
MNPLYHFAHMALRSAVLRDPELLGRIMADPAVATAWISAAAANTGALCGLTTEQTSWLAGSVTVYKGSISGKQAVVLKMPPPQNMTECYFVALFRGTDNKICYYTLESSVSPDQTALCAWSENGHAIFGFVSKPEFEPFVAAIEEAERAFSADEETKSPVAKFR